MSRDDLKSGNVARGDSLTLAASFAGVASLGPITAFTPSDPKFGEQWHLLNTGASGGTPGIDINVTEVWNDYTGSGVVIGIIDESQHPVKDKLKLSGELEISGAPNPTPVKHTLVLEAFDVINSVST